MGKNLLLVDDDPDVLAEFQKQGRACQTDWTIGLAAGATEALDRLSKGSYDVVATDLQMSQMDGTKLLQAVQERYPETVRILLSDFKSQASSLKAVSVAQQFLLKSCGLPYLLEIADRTIHLKKLLANEFVRRLINEMGQLPVLPSVYSSINRLLADPSVDLKDVAEVVEQDLGITTKILQLVNSAFFGLPRRVTNIESAVSYVGTNMVKNVVLSLEIYKEFTPASRMKSFSLTDFQQHAMLVGNIAKGLLSTQEEQEDAFLAGMLHDIGQLVLATKLSQPFAGVLAKAQELKRPIQEIEVEVLGVSHAEIGAYLLGVWGLPYAVVEAVAYHHRPSMEPNLREFGVLGAVHVANSLAHGLEEPQRYLDLEYLERAGLKDRMPAWIQIGKDCLTQEENT